ncbi:baseplate J/gp47 family protein [Thiotrichales bacterium 19S3-7]|nr:baseplate J/gp47 family protein [Thiotrichales bacterium 19S3-7]MCF6803102.1 baseplate J/gp47 family protein [Thiotrichales bacterium 19S3-11]
MKKFDLSKLPLPESIRSVDYDHNYALMLADFKSRMPEYNALVESDPVIKLIEACAYGLTIYEQRIYDSIKSILISFAEGTDLDNLGALLAVSREQDELDNRYRERILTDLEKASSAGSQSAYEALTIEADKRVSDVVAFDRNDQAGKAFVVVQSDESVDGVASNDLLTTVTNYLTAPERKPLGCQVIVLSVEPLEYQINAKVVLDEKSDKELVLKTMHENIQSLINDRHKIAATIPLSEIHARLNIEGVAYVEELLSPVKSISASNLQTPFCTSVTITEVTV